MSAWSKGSRRSFGSVLSALVLATGVQFGRLAEGQSAAISPAEVRKVAAAPELTFDVASVRESQPGSSFRVEFQDPPHQSLVKLTNNNLVNLLGLAYSLQYYQLLDAPAWAQRAMFNVEAKSDSSVDEQLAKMNDEDAWKQKQHMMQVLLADRFKLKAHFETRKGPVYELVVLKSGIKMKPAGSMPPSAEELKNWNGHVGPLYQRGNGVRGYELVGHACPMSELRNMLESQTGTPVLDKTALAGTYDFVLQYNQEPQRPEAEDKDRWPELTVAVATQLGMRLVPTSGDRQVLVIDHVERPTAN